MAKHMRDYLDDQAGGGTTVAGWKVGKAKKTLDPAWVTPKNQATAALYTYTPWVGNSGFGNLAHFKIWKKFAGHVGYAPVGPGGCAAVAFPSGLVAQTLPAPEMTEAYTTLLGPLGLQAADAPTCFLDPLQLEDPSTGTIAPSSSKVSSNFSLSELVVDEPNARQVLVEPAFVSKLQSLRSRLGLAVTVVDAFRSPERHRALCEDACGGSSCLASCEATMSLSLGRAAVVRANASAAKLVDAAKSAGFPTCWVDGGELYVDAAAPGLGCPAN